MNPSLALFSLLACAAVEAPPAGDDSGAPVAPSTIKERCFPDIGDEAAGFPIYDELGAVVADHCQGTDHQEVDTIEKVVFLGDSITAGTPPTPDVDFYRNELAEKLEGRFGPGLEVVDCSEFGARADDLLQHKDRQLNLCFPDGVEEKRTLIIMTMGGNDMMAAAELIAAGGTDTEAAALVQEALDYTDEAFAWIREGSDLDGVSPELSTRFPAGVFMVYSNVYEFTDATGDLGSCPMAATLGFDYVIPQLRDGYIWVSEAYMELAVRYRFDLILMLEQFCGHGYHAGDESNECYRGAEAEIWFDGTCIHPNPTGHEVVSDMFYTVVTDGEGD